MLIVALMVGCSSPCKRGKRCEVADGAFFTVEPASWDGNSALPTVVLFHGWTGAPEQYYDNEEVISTFDEFGWLLVLPEGLDATWSINHMGLEGSGRDELAFVDQVMARTRELWPVDARRTYLSGFSLGASMAYTVACKRGSEYAAMAPMSGGFWLPLPESCDGPEMPVCHIHGLDDETWPIEGRTVEQGDESGTQAPVADDIAFWLDHNGCDEGDVEVQEKDTLTCDYWRGCNGASEVGYCTFEGGHERFDGWVQRELEWMARFER